MLHKKKMMNLKFNQMKKKNKSQQFRTRINKQIKRASKNKKKIKLKKGKN